MWLQTHLNAQMFPQASYCSGRKNNQGGDVFQSEFMLKSTVSSHLTTLVPLLHSCCLSSSNLPPLSLLLSSVVLASFSLYLLLLLHQTHLSSIPTPTSFLFPLTLRPHRRLSLLLPLIRCHLHVNASCCFTRSGNTPPPLFR